MVNSWLNFIHAALYPPVCLLCGAPGEGTRDLCRGCLLDLPRSQLACERCAVPLPPGSSGVCGDCLARPPAYDRVLAPFHYEAPLDWLVPRLKFQARLSHARLLGQLLAEYVIPRTERPDFILPVPLHRRRLRERGFNQALELARPVARTWGIPLRPEIAERTKATPPQMELNARERRRNLRGAFTVTRPLGGVRVAVVDDVATTGATLEALAKALRRAGAAYIECWVVARAG